MYIIDDDCGAGMCIMYMCVCVITTSKQCRLLSPIAK